MKHILTLLALALFCTAALAADLTLSDGRVLKDATIASQTPRTVTIKHSAGLTSVAKTLLPAELQARYPVDEIAAHAADERNQQARLRAQELEQAEYQRSLKLKAEREKTAKSNARAPVEAEADRRDRLNTAKSEVQARSEKYFRTEYPLVTTAKNLGSLKITINDLQLIEGWTNRWTLRGKCEIQYNGETVRVYPTYPPVDVDSRTPAPPPTDLTDRDYYKPYDTTRYSQKTQEFEAIYNAEAPEPTFEVTLK